MRDQALAYLRTHTGWQNIFAACEQLVEEHGGRAAQWQMAIYGLVRDGKAEENGGEIRILEQRRVF